MKNKSIIKKITQVTGSAEGITFKIGRAHV